MEKKTWPLLEYPQQLPAVINFEQNQGTLFGNFETMIVGQKELYDQMLSAKDVEIARMQKIIDSLLSK